MIEKNTSDFIAIYNDTENYPAIADVAEALGISIKTVRNKAGIARNLAKTYPSAPKIITRVSADSDSGIYTITNRKSGRVYVGQAANIKKRWIQHLHHLRKGTHHCKPLQNSFNKNGEESFEFAVVERVDDVAAITEREQFWIDSLNSSMAAGGYNIAPAANSNVGVKYSEESRAKMSAAQKGRVVTDEARAKISKTLTGRKASAKTIEKRQEKLKGKIRSPESVKNIRRLARERLNTPEYEAYGRKQTLRDWAEEFGINKATLRNRVERGKIPLIEALESEAIKGKRRDLERSIPQHGVVRDAPLSETLIPKLKEGTREECIENLRDLAIANPEIAIGRNYYRVHGKYSESVWSSWAGTFEEFKRQAGVILSRQQHAHERHIAKHASVDHYRQINIERQDWDEKYIRDNGNRFKTIITASDLHDIEIDPFYLRVLIDTAKRVQPDVICLVGDVFDLAEFGKYNVDPREWDVVRKIKFAHENIFKPLREACPNAQFDFIEGNHEARLLRQLADATPALRAVLSDLHGFTVGKLLGLDEFEINYIAKADLATWTKREFEKELANNYKVYWDSLICHHFPHARNMGLPGVNGHHHKHEVWSGFNPVYGAYEWHQLGAGHKRSASYCEGERWHNGFAVINVDTATKTSNFDYVPVTDFAVSGGKWYHREKDGT